MTTFILHGGETSREHPENDRFFAQFTAHVDKPKVKILLCYWALEPKKWKRIIARDKDKILQNIGQKEVEFHVLKDAKDLFSKIDEYDVLYVAGGEPEFIEPYYKELGNLKKKLDGKIYIGSSMGVFLASEQYVVSRNSPYSESAHQGVGILPLQSLCHWDAEPKKEFKLDLLTKSSSLPILTLDECKFVTLYQNMA